jgi:hypothetical protein
MFCPQCGITIELSDQKFCHNCGFDLSKVEKNQLTSPSKQLNESQKVEQIKFKIVGCPYCSEDVELSPSEWSEGKFTCPSCKKSVDLSNSHSIPQKKWKWWGSNWGLGWLVIVYLFFSPYSSKIYESFGTTGLLLQLIGCILSLALYFYLRQRVFRMIDKTWLRSLCSVLITYGFVWLLALLAAQILR